jgi:hypothetical protein
MWLALPPVVSLLLLAFAVPKVRAAAWPMPDNARRLVAIWSSIEVAAMAALAVLLKRAGHVDAIAPVMAMIVGAHMLPLAYGLKARFQCYAGFALIAAGLGGFALAGIERTVVTAFACAAILWGSVAYLAYRARAGGRP